MQEKEIGKTKRKRRIKRKQRKAEWRKSKRRRRVKDGQDRRLRERPVVTVLLQSKSALLMKKPAGR
jgi:hypothetical protein